MGLPNSIRRGEYGECAGNGDALLLSSGKPAQQMNGMTAEADAGQQAERELVRLLGVLAIDLDRGFADVLDRRSGD